MELALESGVTLGPFGRTLDTLTSFKQATQTLSCALGLTVFKTQPLKLFGLSIITGSVSTTTEIQPTLVSTGMNLVYFLKELCQKLCKSIYDVFRYSMHCTVHHSCLERKKFRLWQSTPYLTLSICF